MTALPRPTRSAEVAGAIVALITERNLEPGSPLPTEVQLTGELGTSRGPLREALKSLQAHGIVEVRHGYGTFVGPATADAMLPWLRFRARTNEALLDLLDVRELLEVGLTTRVARTGPAPDVVAGLRECVQRMRAGGPDAALADQHFHAIVCRAAGNRLADDLVRVFWRAYAEAEGHIGGRRSQPAELARRHDRIVTALISDDERKIESAVHKHFDEVRRRFTMQSRAAASSN